MAEFDIRNYLPFGNVFRGTYPSATLDKAMAATAITGTALLGGLGIAAGVGAGGGISTAAAGLGGGSAAATTAATAGAAASGWSKKALVAGAIGGAGLMSLLGGGSTKKEVAQAAPQQSVQSSDVNIGAGAFNQYSTQNTNTSTRSMIYSPQLMFGSPGASQNSSPSMSTTATATPTQTPTFTPSFSLPQTSGQSAQQAATQTDSGNLGMIMLLAIVGIGGYALLKSGGKKRR